jgi:DNA repair exonuclease SbcCD ATPase subunit
MKNKKQLLKVKDNYLNVEKEKLKSIDEILEAFYNKKSAIENEIKLALELNINDIFSMGQKYEFINYQKEKLKKIEEEIKSLEKEKEQIKEKIALLNAEKKAIDKYFTLKVSKKQILDNFKEMVESNEIFNRNSIFNKQ